MRCDCRCGHEMLTPSVPTYSGQAQGCTETYCGYCQTFKPEPPADISGIHMETIKDPSPPLGFVLVVYLITAALTYLTIRILT